MNILLLLVLLYTSWSGISATCKLGISSQRGDYYVIGLYSMFANGNSSEYDEHAVRFHLKLRYFIGRQYYSNYKIPIGYVSFDVCNDTSLLVESLMHVVLNPLFKPYQSVIKQEVCNGTSCADSNCYCETCKCSSYSSNILAIVSYLPIDLTRIAADILTSESIPFFAYANEKLISFAAEQRTHPHLYSSYELINHEIFLLGSDISINRIKHVALINIGESTTNLSLYHQQEIWKEVSTNQKLCVQRKVLNPSNTTEMEAYIDYIRRDKSVQMIVLWSDMNSRRTFIELTNNITDRIWYWYTEYSFDNNIDYNLDPLSLETHIFFKHPIYSYQYLNSVFSYKLMKSKLYKSTYDRIMNDIWISRYLDEKGLNKSDPEVFQVFDIKATLDAEYVETVLTPMWWSQPWKKLKYYTLTDMWKWLDYFANTHYRKYVYNLETNTTSESNKWSDVRKIFSKLKAHNACEIIPCFPGYEPNYGIFIDREKKLEKYNWHCVKCPLNSFKMNYNIDKCMKCPIETKSNFDRTNCYDPYTDKYLKIDNFVIIASLALCSIGAIISIIGVFIFIKYKQTPIIRASSQDSCLIHISAHLVLFVTLPFGTFDRPTRMKCILQPVFIGMLLTIVLAITITKTQKFLYAFNSRLVLSKRSVFISKTVEWFILFVLVAIQLIICGITLSRSLPYIKLTLDREALTRDIICTNQFHLQIQLIYILLLSLFCSIQAFRARNLPKHFNETKRTVYAMLMTMLIKSVSFPIAYSQVKNEDRVSITILSISLINSVQLWIMYTYKFYIVLFRPEKNTREAFQLTMMHNAEKNVARVLKSTKRLRTNTMNSILDSPASISRSYES